MGLLGKSRMVSERPAAGAAQAAVAPAPSTRPSNGLKDFLWLLGEVEHGHLLDLGPVWQSTVSFFTERGFRLYTEDLLRAWKEFLREEEARWRAAPVGTNGRETDPVALAERFVETSLQYPDATFHAILAWDLFDYLDAELLPRLAERLHGLLRPEGVLLAAFHTSKPERFHRYRVLDGKTVELVSAPPLVPPLRVFQNREILNLFDHFRSSKTFVGRDHLREVLFRK